MLITGSKETAASRFVESLKNEKRRLHMTNSERIHLTIIAQSNRKTKPKGLWYGIETSWIEWCQRKMPDWLDKYIYEIKIDEDVILKIEDEKQFDEFEKKYAMPCSEGIFEKHSRTIDYQAISESFCGIEISPVIEKRKYDSLWYYGWDCASGCIWDARAIKSIRLFAQFDEHSNQYVRCD